LLQTIVENCIKHGIAKVVEPGYVKILVEKKEPFLRIYVEDSGVGIDLSRIHKGTGLRNSLQRMRDIYNQDDLLRFERLAKGTRVVLDLPLS
jgi:two-component system LytT family sensor kinase